MHIRYSSPVHARQALAKNATLFHGQMIGVVPCRERDALTVQETTVPQKSRNSSNGSCSFLENDMSSLLHFNGGDTPTRLVPSTSFCKEDISVPRFYFFRALYTYLICLVVHAFPSQQDLGCVHLTQVSFL